MTTEKTPVPAAIDQMAEAARIAYFGQSRRGPIRFDGVIEESRETWRGVARAVLEAAASGAAPADMLNEIENFLEKQDALDNHELNGPNAEDYFAVLRRRNIARKHLDAALASREAAPADPVHIPIHLCREATQDDIDAWAARVSEAAALASPQVAPASGQYSPTELQARIVGAVSDYASMEPEEDEDWESWYVAAFSMLGERVDAIFKRAAPAPAAPTPAQPSEDARDAARYRVLRKNSHPLTGVFEVAQITQDGLPLTHLYGEQMDAAVDALPSEPEGEQS